MLGLVPFPELPEIKQPAFVKNLSERFEARFSSVQVMPSPSILMSEDMVGSILGLHQNHGSGRFDCPDQETMDRILDQNLAFLRFVDDDGKITETYPLNPNGSAHGINALCDPTGRHNVIMGHPERTVLRQQWLWLPGDWQHANSPWLRLFQNAYHWSIAHYREDKKAA
jgi:phosphoribosylformylglycinamidine synthase